MLIEFKQDDLTVKLCGGLFGVLPFAPDQIERLLGKGIDLKLYDRNVSMARLTGANRDYILKTIPHISNLMVETVDEVLDHAEVLVVGNGDAAFRQVPDQMRDGQQLVDFVRISEGPSIEGRYDGVAW